MAKRIVAIDIDDVIADSTDALRLLVNKRAGVDLQEHHYRVPGEYWGYYEQVWRIHGIDKKIDYQQLEQGLVVDQSHILPTARSIDVITRLSENFDIILVTARDEKMEEATKRWLNIYLGSVFRDLHIIGNHKTKIAPRTKGEVCLEVGASWLIDDNPGHCLSAIDHGVDAILFGDYGWHHEAPDHLTVCRDWNAVGEYFSGITE